MKKNIYFACNLNKNLLPIFLSFSRFFTLAYMGANGQKCLFFLKNPGREIYFIFPFKTCLMNQNWAQKNLIFPSRRGKCEIWEGNMKFFFFFFYKNWLKSAHIRAKSGASPKAKPNLRNLKIAFQDIYT